MIFFGSLLAVLIGVSLGLLGGGGAILAVPVFNYVLGFGAKEAIASNLVVIGVTSLAVTGSFAGTYLLRFVPQRMLRKTFAVFLVLMAIFILYQNWEVISFV